MFFLQLILIGLLLMIFIEDMRSRAVHWFLFPLLALAFIALRLINHHPVTQVIADALVNLSFVALQLILVTAYFSIKHQRWVKLTSGLLGWGDILLIGCLTFYLPPLNFTLFYVLSLIVVLTGWLFYQQLNHKSDQQIPLAGLQSVLLAAVCIIAWFYPKLQLTQDNHLLQLISR